MHSDQKQQGRRRGGIDMTRLFVITVFWVYLLASSAWGEPSAERIAVITPPDKSVLEGPLVDVALRIPADYVDEIRIFVNGRKVQLPKRQYKVYTACFDGIGLTYGLNDIRIVAMRGGKQVDETHSQVFFRSDLSSSASSAPDGFKSYFFHDYDREKGCMPCHQLDFSAFNEGETTAERSPCYQCHKKILNNYGTVHGPAAVWSCLSCHDKKGSPKLSVVKPDSKVCFSCHEDSWTAMKFGHGPTAAGSCATCHNPHASDYPFFLRAPPGDLCLGCHAEIVTKPHVITGFSSAGHPVRKSPDPYHPNRDFTCVSCHNPHAGKSWAFLQNYDDTTSITNFCRNCHFK